MGFLDRFRSKGTLRPEWREITAPAHLDDIEAASFDQPVVIFKHSTSCGISAGAKYRLEDGWRFDENSFQFYYLDLLAHRAISNAIAERFGVTHQSPQLIVLSQGKAIHHTSHHQISQQWLGNATS